MKRTATVVVTLVFALIGLNTAVAQDLTYEGVNRCSGCHSGPPGGNVFPFWQQTAHAAAYDSASAVVQNTASCLQCHTTGWDPEVDNTGADDFVTINEDGSITIDDAAGFEARVNVQCESCHGPSSGHADNIFATGEVPPLDPAEAETCGACHQDEHHPYIEEWSMSAHATSTTHPVGSLQDQFRNSPQCSGCHTFQGFVEFVGTTPADTINIIPDVTGNYGDDAKPLACAACHDPHDAKHGGQLRLPVEDLCVKCHNSEGAMPGEDVHHATSEMWDGVGAVEFPGFDYRTESVHQILAAEKKCATCHVFATGFGEDPNDPSAKTGHTFEPRIESCSQEGCHVNGLDIPAGSERQFDHRGRQTFTDSLRIVLADLLANATSEDSASETFEQALFNLQFEESARSSGVHNPVYSEDILVSTIAVWKGFTSVEPTPTSDAGIPTEFLLHQNYPNPFNPATTIRFDVPRSSHVQLIIYNSLGQAVETLVDETLAPNSYEIEFSAADLSSGLYFYKLISDNFVTTKKMLLLK